MRGEGGNKHIGDNMKDKNQPPLTNKERAMRQMSIVASCFGVGVQDSDVLSYRRTERIVLARQTIYWLLRKSDFTYPRISLAVNRDHAATIKGFKQIEGILELDLEGGYCDCIKNSFKYYKDFYREHLRKENERAKERIKDVV